MFFKRKEMLKINIITGVDIFPNTLTLYFNEHDRIQEVLSKTLHYLGLKKTASKTFRFSTVLDPLSHAKKFIGKDERVQVLLSAFTKSREVTLYLSSFTVNSSHRHSSQKYIKTSKSHSVETSIFEFEDTDSGIAEFSCKLKNKKATLKIFPRLITYVVSGTYAKEKKVCFIIILFNN